MNDTGEGISVNKEEAAIYYKKGADLNNAGLTNNYAFCLYYGEGVQQNKKEAAVYF